MMSIIEVESLASQEKRTSDIGEIIMAWRKATKRREWILENMMKLSDIESERTKIAQELKSQSQEMLKAWNEAVRKRNSTFNKVKSLLKKEKGMENILGNIKMGDVARDEAALGRIRKLSERENDLINRERELAKQTREYMEQCRLLMHHQKGKIDDFMKNL